MEKRKQQIVVFWPVGQWVVFGGLSAEWCWVGLTNSVLAICMVSLFVGLMVWTPVPVVGRESLWLVRLCGLYWKRVRGRDLGAVVMMSRSLILKDHEGWIDEVSSFSMRRNRRIAEALHERFGVEIKPHRP